MLESSLEVTVGGGVTFSFSVVNAGHTPIELTFRDACRADFTVYEGEEAIWCYSDGKAFTQSISVADLQPGEKARFEETWPDPRPGDYTAEATLCVEKRGVTAQTPFSV